MATAPPGPPLPYPESLCHRCVHRRYIRGRTSTFVMCTALAEKYPKEGISLDAHEGEEQSDRSEGEGRRVADEHEDDQPREHEGRKIVPDQMHHCRGVSYLYLSL